MMSTLPGAGHGLTMLSGKTRWVYHNVGKKSGMDRVSPNLQAYSREYKNQLSKEVTELMIDSRTARQ